MYRHGVIGNCQSSALVGCDGSVDWMCLPRPDSPPVFGRLLDADGGGFSIHPAAGVARSSQRYLDNTAVLETCVYDAAGNGVRITDFFPRFLQYGRSYRPMQLFRVVEPIGVSAEIVVTCDPRLGWSRERAQPVRGNSHISYDGFAEALRLTTNFPMLCLMEGLPHRIHGPMVFVLSWGAPVHEDLLEIYPTFLRRTVDSWRDWVKRGRIPALYQKEVIRSAITLKLHCFEETGGVLAAMTTSLPEIAGDVRNWDYRFCWVRDAYFTVSALYKLGYFEELEGLLNFLLNVLEGLDEGQRLAPVLRIDGTLPLPELVHDAWSGFADGKPVRSGNDAATHVQNDVYGELMLTLTPLFFDERFVHLRDARFQKGIHNLAQRCYSTLGEADAGLWELRSGWKVHNFSTLLTWAGLDRYVDLLRSGVIPGDVAEGARMRDAAKARLLEAVRDGILWNSEHELVTDASLALLTMLRFPDEALCRRTTERIASDLTVKGHEGFFFRYRYPDDFGTPKHPFVICSFWMAQAMARLGALHTARNYVEQVMRSANHLGLLAEHVDPESMTQWGNFPQCYSHVGLIQAAYAVSPQWDDVL